MPLVDIRRGGARHLDSLTGLRAVAALVVFLTHVQMRLGEQQQEALYRVTVQGGLGVTFFFALSGFVLTWSFRDGDGARSFWRRRAARIVPAYVVALLGGTLVTLAAHGRSGVSDVQTYDSPSELVGPFAAQLSLLQAWIPDERYYFSLNSVGWSLSCEAFFYACFPAVIAVVWRMSVRQRRALQVVCLLLLLAAAFAVDRGASSWLVHHAPPVRLLDFVLGVSVGVDVVRGGWSRLRLWPSLVASAGAFALAGWWVTPYSVSLLPIVPFLMVIAAAAHRDLQASRTVFSTRTFVWLGQVSFAFYLIHQIVVRCLGVFPDSATWAGAGVRIAAALCLSLLAAWALHVLVERPAERRLRGTGRSRPVPGQAGPVRPAARPTPVG